MSLVNRKEIRKLIFNKYNGHCSYCGCKIILDNFHIDHIYPKRRYPTQLKHGKCEIENFNPSCVSCNLSKNSLELEKWRNEIHKKYQRLLRDSSTFRLLIRFGIIKKRLNNVKFYYEKFK